MGLNERTAAHLKDEELVTALELLLVNYAGNVLTRAELAESVRITQGLEVGASARCVGVSPETIRARRKRVYRKLNLSGAQELVAAILAMAATMALRGEQLEIPTPSSADPAAGPGSLDRS